MYAMFSEYSSHTQTPMGIPNGPPLPPAKAAAPPPGIGGTGIV